MVEEEIGWMDGLKFWAIPIIVVVMVCIIALTVLPEGFIDVTPLERFSHLLLHG